MPDYRHDPILNYNANLLKQAGTEQYTQGRDTTTKGVGELQPVYDYFKSLLSGDTKSLMDVIQPQADVISQQFNQVRSMIGDQARGGGKTSTLAELPIEQIKALAGLIGGARSTAAQNAGQVASTTANIGNQLTGQGLSAATNAANLALAGRNQDLGHSFQSNFLSNFGSSLGSDLAGALI
jgi:hypothetical protein